MLLMDGRTSVFSLLLILNAAFLLQGQEICEDGWQQYDDGYGNTVCALVVAEPASWNNAAKYCNDRLAKLLVLDLFGDMYDGTKEQTVYIGEDIVEKHKVEEFWSGLHVERGRLMWDDYGPKLVHRNRYSNSRFWSWNEGQPDRSVGSCGKASISKRNTGEGIVYNYQQLRVNLTNCNTRLPFVCRKPPLQPVVKTASFCPENWLGNQYLPHCFRIYKEPVSYDEARARCQQEGSGLAPSITNFDLIFQRAVFDFYFKTDIYFEVTQINNIWVEDTNSSRRCGALNTVVLQSSVPRLDDRDCDSTFLYMCITETLLPVETGSIVASSPYFDQKTLSKYNAFTPLPVYGVLPRILHENEVVFAITPSFILNSTNSYRQWSFQNTIFWDVRESDRVAVPYYANITIPSDPLPQRRRRDTHIRRRNTNIRSNYPVLTDRGKRQDLEFGSGDNLFDERVDFINYNDIPETTGYYSFGLYNINPPRYEQMEPQLVRYSEKHLYIFVAYCDVLDYVIGPALSEPILTRENTNSFNLLRDDSYISEIFEIGLSGVLGSTPEDFQDIIAYYEAKIESFKNNTVMFRVFIAPRLVSNLVLNQESTLRDVVFDHFRANIPSDYFNRSSLTVHGTVSCPFIQTTVDGKNVTFEPVRAGQTGFSWERCYPDNKALATATCTGGFDNGTSWSSISLANDCGIVPKLNESNTTNSLKNLSEVDLTRENYFEVLNNTVNLTGPGLNLTEADVIYTADILYNYLQFEVVNTKEVMDTVFEVVDNVLRAKEDAIDSAQKITNAANRIILSLDELTNKLFTYGDEVTQFIQDYVASEVWDQSGTGDLTIGFSLTGTGTIVIEKDELNTVRQPADVEVSGTDTAIYLTENLIKDGDTRLTFHIYSKTELFTVLSSKFKVNSKVAAARLERDDQPVVDLGDEHVTAIFYLLEESSNLVCAHWNYSANEGAGGWASKGCTLTSLQDGRVMCECNHLTNFAVLIDLEAGGISDTHKLVLGIITKVGLVISIVALGITIVTFLLFKHLRNGRGQQVLVNLSVALICSSVLFLVGVERTESYNGCIAVSALLHYFILVTFMWMLVEGVLQYLRFVKVLGTYIPKFMIKSMIPAWGIPLIPVIIVLAIDYNLYYGGKGYCWLSWTPFLYAFLIPVAAIIFANLVVFMMVMCNLCCRRKNKTMVSNQSDRKMAFLHFQAGLSILIILGLTWVFGFLTIDDTRIAFHYLFAIFNAFQGFFIFMLFTAREKQIRAAWRKLCCKKSPYKSTSSDSNPHKHSADTTHSTGLHNKSADHRHSIDSSNENGGHSNGHSHHEHENY